MTRAFRPTNALAGAAERHSLTPRISTPDAGRKPPHFSNQPRPWKRKPTTPAGDHYLRPIVAARVKEQTVAGRAHALLQQHLRAAKKALPSGKRGAPELGKATACRILDAFHGELDKRAPGSFAGGAVAFCAAFGIHVGVDAASAAMRLVADVTPLLQRDGRFSWSIDLGAAKRSSLDDRLMVEIQIRLSHPAKRPASAVTASPEIPLRESEPLRTGSREHAHAVVAHVLNSSGGARSEPEPAACGLGCASPAPAEEARARPAVSPARAADAPLLPLTESSWQQAFPRRIHAQRLLVLLAGRFGEPLLGSAREIVDRIAREDGRWTSRLDRFGLLRALHAAARRGLVVLTTTRLELPAFEKHEVLDMLDMKPRPSPIRPTLKQERVLERQGVDPAGLSRGEARVVTYVLRKRAEAGSLSYRQIEAIGSVMGHRPAEVSRTIVAGRQVDFEMFMGLVRSVQHDHGAIHG